MKTDRFAASTYQPVFTGTISALRAWAPLVRDPAVVREVDAVVRRNRRALRIRDRRHVWED